MRKQLYGIDIFSGAGGLSLGAEMAGIKVKHAIEIDESAALTFKKNHKDVTVHQGDIKEIKSSKLKIDEDPVFIIMGGPPCQGFSLSNTRTRNMNNLKNFLFLEFVRIVRDLKPTWFVLENVKGLTNMEDGNTQKLIENCFKELGYEVNSQVLCASDFGVPQNRYRFFMVGSLSGIKFEFPQKQGEVITVEDAIGDLPDLENGQKLEIGSYKVPFEKASRYAQAMRRNSSCPTQNFVSKNNDLVIQRYSYIKQGENWSAIPDELMQNYKDKKMTHSGIYKRLKADEPSVVISNYRKSMLIHPYQNRGLSVREAARLQSFPDDFYFCGPISRIQQQIGNAVPPLLAYAVFKQIIKLTHNYEQR